MPVPSRVLEAMASIRAVNHGFVFSASGGEAPIGPNRVTEYHNIALKRMGISEQDRKARRLSFHRWRAFFNSMMRSHRISDAKVRLFTGHATMEMTDRYTVFNLSDYEDVVTVQKELF